MPQAIRIGQHTVGDGQPVFVIAEIGSNHNGDWSLALQTIDAAVEAGVDAVKFQTFRASSHVSSKARTPSYLKTDEKLQDIIRALEINRDWHQPLADYCASKGVEFFSSPCDREAVDELEAVGAPAHKVASFDLPDTDLVAYIAAKHKPVILSTGLADWMEIQRAIDACHAVGNHQVILLQCTSLYPAPAGLSNLAAMASMRQAFGVLTGYSDHTMGDNVTCAAVALGACVIEKHITMDRSLPGPDHPFAMEPAELKLMMHRIREIEIALGDGVKNGPRPQEQEMADLARRSLHAARDIAAGTTITADMMAIKRPGLGIAPSLRKHVVGRIAKHDIDADAWITWDMLG
jgi:sialic acid synthase SpsE